MGKHIAVYVSVSSGSRDTASQEADLLRWSDGGGTRSKSGGIATRSAG
jgi:hypothetical protein